MLLFLGQWLLLFILLMASVVLITILLRALMFFGTMLFGAPYVATRETAIQSLLHLAQLKSGQRAIDLGSGDGRVVVALAAAGAQATGIELNPLLVTQSRRLIKRMPQLSSTGAVQKSAQSGSAEILQGSFWQHDLSSYDVIFFYGTTYLLPRLAEKLEREAKKGARIISNYFALPGWQVAEERQGLKLYKKE